MAAWVKRPLTKRQQYCPGREGLRRTSCGFRGRKQQRVQSFWYKVFNVTLYKQDYNSQRVSTVLKGGGCFRADLALSPLLSAALATVQCELVSLRALTYLRDISGELESFTWKSAKCLRYYDGNGLPFQPTLALSAYVLRMRLLCSFSLFCSILGFDRTPSYQGLLATHPFCSCQCPSLSQSLTLTCTALYPTHSS